MRPRRDPSLNTEDKTSDFSKEREFLYKALFDLKKELSDLKNVVGEISQEISMNFSEMSKEFLDMLPEIRPVALCPVCVFEICLLAFK